MRTYFEEGLRPAWFPFLSATATNARIAVVALAPLAVTGAALVAEHVASVLGRVAAAAGVAALVLTFWIGASGPSWW